LILFPELFVMFEIENILILSNPISETTNQNR
jgi:hypothetical protein